MQAFKDEFLSYLTETVGQENLSAVLNALDEPASVSVRLNPFKKAPVFENALPVPWSEYGYFLGERPVFTLDPFFHAGSYYVQDSSSMFVGHVFRWILDLLRRSRLSGTDNDMVRVLDLCAAPGGKTTDLAASLRQVFGEKFLLVANEVVAQRASVLASNVALWGDPNVMVTSSDPSAFSRLDGVFDVVLADVPCSGEGMFRKDENAVSQWSAENVKLCAARQRRILADVWPAVAEGGCLIYSTCTFNRFENDGNVAWAAENLGAEILYLDRAEVPEGVLFTDCGYSLVPGFVRGEGQYCAVLRKLSSGAGPEKMLKSGKRSGQKSPAAKDRVSDFFDIPVRQVEVFGMLKAVPEVIADLVSDLESKLRVLSSGCAAGCVKGRDFVPDPDLALCIALATEAFPRVEVDREQALAFLHGDALTLPQAPKGYVILCFEGAALGFVKNIGNRCNNLHPAGRRIRMNIKL